MKRFLKSINGKISILIIIMTVFTLTSLILSEQNEERNMRIQSNESIRKNLDLYAGNINTSIELLDEQLMYFPIANDGVKKMSLAEGKKTLTNIEYWDCVVNITNNINDLKYNYPFVENIFVYFPKQGVFVNEQKNPGMTEIIYKEIDTFRNETEKLAIPWKWVKTTSGLYLYEIYYIRNTYIGAWINCNRLMNFFGIDTLTNNDQNIEVNIASSQARGFTENIPAYDSSDEEPYISASIDNIDSVLYCHVIEDDVVQNIRNKSGPYIIWIFVIHFAVLGIMCVGIVIWINRPLNFMHHEIELIKKDKNHRIKNYPSTSREFEDMYESLNEMLDLLEKTKNQIYEQKLKDQETKLRYLGQQIQPHFMLNALNTIYTYIDQNPEQSRRIIMLLSSYYRYAVNVESKYMPLWDELNHIENYLKFQKIRLEERLDYKIICDDKLKITPVPPFLLESFIGNSLKYGIDENDHIFIQIRVEEIANFIVKIQIRDHGEGFSDDELEVIQNYIETENMAEELGVGMRNSIERIRLIYKDEAEIKIFNDSGAVVELVINLQKNVLQ